MIDLHHILGHIASLVDTLWMLFFIAVYILLGKFASSNLSKCLEQDYFGPVS